MADDGFFTCGVVPIGVGPEVFGQVALMNNRVDETLNATLDLAGQLAGYQVSSMNFSIDPSVILNYAIKTLDDDIVLEDVQFDDPGSIPTIADNVISTPALPDGEPVAPPDAPNPVIPAPVHAYHPSFGPTPTILFPAVPSYGDLTSGIPFPDLIPIVLPAPPDVDFGIAFTATPPVFTAPPPDAADFDYTEQPYSELLITDLKAAILKTLNGETGIPKVVEDALWAREAEREAATAAAAIQDANDENASKGFTLPTGVLAAKIEAIKQNSQNQKNSLGRDVMIKIHDVLVDQFKYGILQGISLENANIQLYSDIQGRRLTAAQVAVNIAISVYNALVAQYQAAAEVFKVEAEVYATRIQAELAKLQAYSEEIKAQQLIGELNQQAVAIYTARLGAIETNVRVYLANIQAYTAQIEGEKLKLDTFRTTIEIEDEKLKANRTELDIWTGQIQGQNLIQTAAQTRAQTYMTAVQAWKTKYEAQIDRQRGEIASMQAQTERYLARIQGITAEVDYQAKRAQVIIAKNAARVQQFEVEMSGVNSYNTALGEKIRAVNAGNAQNTELALKNGEINAQNGLAAKQLEEQALQATLQVLAQITASFASSVNLSGNVSDSTQFGQSCNYNTSQSF